jgi:hypothetical protein
MLTASRRVSEGTRTPDRLDHNQELYQLSYAHRGIAESTSADAALIACPLTHPAWPERMPRRERPRQDSNLRPTA